MLPDPREWPKGCPVCIQNAPYYKYNAFIYDSYGKYDCLVIYEKDKKGTCRYRSLSLPHRGIFLQLFLKGEITDTILKWAWEYVKHDI